MEGLTPIKDIDREILLQADDETLLKMCVLNKNMNKNVCNNDLFRRRMEQRYPHLIPKEVKDWKSLYLKTIYYIGKLKEEFDFKFVDGNPEKYFDILQDFRLFSRFHDTFGSNEVLRLVSYSHNIGYKDLTLFMINERRRKAKLSLFDELPDNYF